MMGSSSSSSTGGGGSIGGGGSSRLSMLARPKEGNDASLLRTSLGGESMSSAESVSNSPGHPHGHTNGHVMPGGSPVSRTATKGKARAMEPNPFADPDDDSLEAHPHDSPRNKPRPTPQHPIVTVGGTPKVRRHLGPSIGPDGQRLPSIVSIDTDAEQAANISGSKYEMNRGLGYGRSRNSKPNTIAEDQEGEQQAAARDVRTPRRIGELAPPTRKSTADSKFSEVGLDAETSDSYDDEEEYDREAHHDEHEQHRQRERHSRPAGAHEDGGRRVAWWTEWLFCCGGPPPDDEQVRNRDVLAAGFITDVATLGPTDRTD